jgi:hypothetical protein
MSLQVIHNEASKLLAHPEVSVTVDSLKQASLKSVDVTATDIVRTAWQIAQDDDAPHSSRVSALALLAKRHPEFSEKHDISMDQRLEVAQITAEMSIEEMREFVRRTLGAQ